MILVLPNVTMELSNMIKQIRVPPNVTKVQLEMMLILHIVIMELSNVRKNQGTTKCEKSIDRCDVGIA